MKRGLPILLILSLLVLGCAQIQSPDGGPRDREAPAIVLDGSSPNFQKNFRPNKVEITFDEWVKLKSGGQGIIISPQPKRKARFQIKRKTLEVEFDENDTLQDNTTYLIQLGDEVVDITEENPTDNFVYVFSTGDYIDSLSLNGRVEYLDQSIKPKWENIRAYLYKDWQDTSFVNQTPYYVTKIDSAGPFQFNYLSEGDYRLVVIDDDNKNTAYERAEDRIGFLDEIIHIPLDTSLPIIQLYEEWAEFYLEDIDTSKLMRTVLEFTREPGKLDIISQEKFLSSWNEQRLIIEHFDTIYPKVFYFVDSSIDYRDSLVIVSTEDKESINLELNVNQLRANSVDVKDSFSVSLNQPVRIVDASLITFLQASKGDLVELDLDENDAIETNYFVLKMKKSLDVDSSYSLHIYPGALEDMLGRRLEDSLAYSFINRSSPEGGNLTIKLVNLDSTTNYVLELQNSNNRNRTEAIKFSFTGYSSHDIAIDNLRSGKYLIFITEDQNYDSKWTPGDVDRWQIPEERYLYMPPDIRENWDTEFKIDLK